MASKYLPGIPLAVKIALVAIPIAILAVGGYHTFLTNAKSLFPKKEG